MPLLVVALVLLVLRVVFGILGPSPSGETVARVATADLVRWHAIAGAEEAARAAGRPLLYDFTADWCPPCQRMKSEVFADERAAELINRNFVPVRVLDRSREEGRNAPAVDSLQSRFRIEAFPTLVVASPDGGEPVVLTGYRGKDETVNAILSARAAVSTRRVPR